MGVHSMQRRLGLYKTFTDIRDGEHYSNAAEGYFFDRAPIKDALLYGSWHSSKSNDSEDRLPGLWQRTRVLAP